MHDPDVVHVADGRHQLPHDAAGLRFAEMLLPADPFQQLPSAQQLQHQVRVELQQTQKIRLCCQIIQVQNTKEVLTLAVFPDKMNNKLQSINNERINK